MPAAVRIVTLPPGTDLAPGSALRLVPTPAHATHRGTAFGPTVLTVQEFADELVRTNDPAAQPLTDADTQLVLDLVSADLRDAGERSETKLHAMTARRRQKLRRLGASDRLRRAAELWRTGKRRPFDAVKVPAEPNAAPGARLAPLLTVTNPAMLPLPPSVAPLLTDTAEASERIGETTKVPFTNIAPVLTVVAPLCWPLPVSVQVPLPTFVMLVAALVVVLPPSVILPAKVVFVLSAPML